MFKKRVWSYLIVLLFFIMISGCDEEISQAPCILEEIILDEFNSLKFRTISGGRVYQLVQEFTLEGQVDTIAYFQYVYFLDSLVVLNLLDPGQRPYMSVSFENERPIEVLRYFTSTGVLLYFDFEYNEANLRINLTRIASNGDRLLATYAIYHYDENENIERVEQFGIDQEDRSNFVVIQNRTFNYDNESSPLKNLYLPFFANANVPSVEFFSTNNIISVKDENGRIEIDYQFNEFNKVVKQINPDGTELNYGYLNCQ